ncbi:hypothetical protein F4X73_18490 [Candidatus Poribacteria bacterium]|nr:hypothetical protein [Candidatus Poribacteria bacterium]MYB66677.1 hypothetical protein [Candidatus Poribacteria bacterium]
MLTNISYEFQRIHDFESLIAFLRDTLRWPIPDTELEIEDVTFDWAAEDLRLNDDIQAHIISCRQLRIFDLTFDIPTRHVNLDDDFQQLQLFDLDTSNHHEPWGIFIVEFENDVKIDACRTILRRVVRGLVGGPKHAASLPFWSYDKLLFICTTTDFQNIGFVRCMGKKSRLIVDDYIPLNDFKLNV